MSDQSPPGTRRQVSWRVRVPGEVLATAEDAGLLPPATGPIPSPPHDADLLRRVLHGLHAWHGPAPAREHLGPRALEAAGWFGDLRRAAADRSRAARTLEG